MKVNFYEVSYSALKMMQYNFDTVVGKSKISGLYHVELKCDEIRVYENHIEIFTDGYFRSDGIFINPGVCKISKDDFSELVI